MVYQEDNKKGKYHTDYPIQYEDKSIAYEFPERVPAYIKEKVAKIYQGNPKLELN